jgi:hypothetical protein
MFHSIKLCPITSPYSFHGFIIFKCHEYTVHWFVTKQYVIYTLNDDGVSEDVTLLINEYVVENDQPKIVPIPKEEVNLVLTFYNNLRNNI